MKYIVAVSGGVDSVVLLDLLKRSERHELVVAHFDHGTREDSASDAEFVRMLANKYGLAFITKREELGAEVSEALARERRYTFLRSVAKSKQASIVTAHHADDLIETIAINIKRGTGWRGLAVFGAQDIVRPLLNYTKQDMYAYATEHRLEWVEDSTNASDLYLRNRLRFRIAEGLSRSAQEKLRALWMAQIKLRAAIDTEVLRILSSDDVFSRYFFITTPAEVAIELLRQVVFRETGRTLLRSQLERGVLAIKTALPPSTIQLGEGVKLSFTKTTFVARRVEKML